MSRRSGRNGQLRRLLATVRTLHRRGGCDIYELAAEHGTTPRTILRDLAALEELGLPLVADADGRRNRWRIEYQDELHRIAQVLDASHYVAVIAALGGAAASSRPATRHALADLANKIAVVLRKEDRSRLARIASAFATPGGPSQRSRVDDVLSPVLAALANQTLCAVDYTSVARRRSHLEILPLRLRAQADALYLLGYLPKRDDIVTLSLDRIRSLRLLDRRCEVPAHLEVDRYLSSMLGIDGSGDLTSYLLRFDAEVTPYIEARVWHPSQQLRRLRKGGVELAFTCRASVEVSGWVASWREHVEVMAPQELRRELAELGSYYRQRYDASTDQGR